MTKRADDIRRQIASAVTMAVIDPDVPAKVEAAGPIADSVIAKVGPELINRLDAEPWFQSRVTIGAIITLIGGSYSLLLDFLDGVPPPPDDFAAQLAAIVGAGVVLYGRWVARKPLGA